MSDLFVQGINDTTLYAEKLYSQNFTAENEENLYQVCIIMVMILIYLSMVNEN